MIENIAFGDVTLRYASRAESSASLPDTANVCRISPKNSFRLSEYVTGEQVTAYMTGVLERFGFSPEDAAAAGENIGAMLAFF